MLEVLTLALVHGTAVALVALALEPLARRWLSPALLGALWLVVLLKFVVPVGPAFRFSLSSAVAQQFEPLQVLASPASEASALPWRALLGAAYLTSCLALAARQLLAAHHLARSLRALPRASPELLEEVRRAAKRLGLRSSPEVRLGAGPYVFGCWRPTLVLPDEQVDQAVLLHELAHLRRGDHWTQLLQHLAQVLFFFWPPVRWVNRRIEQHRELACDQLALDAGAFEPTRYARVLLGTATANSHRLTLDLGSNPSSLERRIDMVLNRSWRSSTKLGVVAVVGWATLALSGSALGKESAAGVADKDAIAAVISSHVGEISSCYERAIVETPTLAGKVEIGFTIAHDGAVRGASVRHDALSPRASSAGKSQFTSCLTAAVASWHFTPAQDGGEVEVVYPFQFNTQGF